MEAATIDLDIELPVFLEAPRRGEAKFCYLSWLEEIEPFRQHFEANFGKSNPRREGWSEPFVL